MMVAEFSTMQEAIDFLEKYCRHSVRGQRILVDWFTTREKRQGHIMKRYKEQKKKRNRK